MGTDQAAGVAVFTPDPLLTITIEQRGDDPDVHLHAGGQGFWLARMVAALDVPVTLCGPFGGETGRVLRTLIEGEGVSLCAVEVDAANVAYVHDRRSGARTPIAEMAPSPLSRHDLDELYGAMLTAAMRARVCLLGGPQTPSVLPADTYRRLCADLHAAHKVVVADLSGDALSAAVAASLDVVKVSADELVADGRAASGADHDVVEALRVLRTAGVATAVVSRAHSPALAAWDHNLVEIITPRFEPVDPRGAGDSMTAGIAAGLARGEGIESALKLGAAAGSLNVARRGLATGRRADIEEMARHVELRTVGATGFDVEIRSTERATVDELAARAKLS